MNMYKQVLLMKGLNIWAVSELRAETSGNSPQGKREKVCEKQEVLENEMNDFYPFFAIDSDNTDTPTNLT